MPSELPSVLAALDADRPAALQRLCDLLRIPSISTDPAHKADVARAADWLVADLRTMGFNATSVNTHGHPMVLAHHPGTGGSDAPRVLYYGHYDVQPADPLELWNSPPFEPQVVDGPHGKRVVARGAVDDKGQVMMFIEAFRAWHRAAGGPPCPVTVMLEGEEESGSESLEPFMTSHAKELACDVAVVSDTGMWDIDTPAITTSLRGLCYLEAILTGPSHDLHSGMYGGSLRNPINALAAMIASLHDDQGRVAVKGFYDGIVDPAPQVLESWKRLGFDESEFLGGAGVKHGWGEPGRSVLERTWSRPTCDCNGIVGGYTGVGAKTVIASKASVKLSCRLVPGQDPERVFRLVCEHLQARVPQGYSLEILSHGRNAAIGVKADSPYVRAAQAALKGVFHRDAPLIGTGGSIPAVGSIQRILGVDSLLVGFGLDDDRVHSPNEKFEVKCFENGARSHAAMLAEFGRMAR
jgi:acetylornithine deacetylase/succinyl-diaminopimelate desuccinylase-like protein